MSSDVAIVHPAVPAAAAKTNVARIVRRAAELLEPWRLCEKLPALTSEFWELDADQPDSRLATKLQPADIAPENLASIDRAIREALSAPCDRAVALTVIGAMADAHPATRPASTEIFVHTLVEMARDAGHSNHVIARACRIVLSTEKFAITPAAFLEACTAARKELQVNLHIIGRRRRIAALLRQLPAPAPAQHHQEGETHDD